MVEGGTPAALVLIDAYHLLAKEPDVMSGSFCCPALSCPNRPPGLQCHSTMETAANNQRQKLLVLLAWGLLFLLAWSLWLWQLDFSDLTFDETATYSVAHRPFIEILGYLREAVREHPPVYYLLIHGWMMLAGAGEFSLRFPSVGAGMVALALTGWLARVTMRRSAVAGSLWPRFSSSPRRGWPTMSAMRACTAWASSGHCSRLGCSSGIGFR